MTSELTCIIVAVMLIASRLGSTDAITVVSGPTDTKVFQGDTVELRCIISNKGNIDVHWLRENQYLTQDYSFYPDAINPRYTVVDNGKRNVEFVLRISNVQLSDAGRFQCGHYQPIPSFRSASLTVSTSVSMPQGQQPPNQGFPRCKSSPQNAQVDETVTLTCTSEGGNPPARLTWFQLGEPITGGSESPNSVDRTLREEHNGVQFRCRLNHDSLANPRFCNITPLRILPMVRIEPPEVIDEVGQGALFTCVANGIPEISKYTFFFDNVEVKMRPDAERFVISGDFRTLTIKSVIEADDNVPVRCDVSIPSGLSASSSGLLRVRGLPTNYTTVTPSVTYSNMTEAGGLSRSNTNLIFIIVGTVVGQILLVSLVFVIHRSLKRKEEESMKMMNMEWRGVTNSKRNPHEIVPHLANLTAPRRYTDLNSGEVAHPRYQDLDRNSLVTPPPLESSDMEVGVYEGVATREPPEASKYSPKHPPPRASPTPSKPRLSSETSSPRPSSGPPRNPPPRASPRLDGPRVPGNPSDGMYSRPTSNALSSVFEDTASYQGSVIKNEADFVCYDEPPVEYIKPLGEEDTVYEVPPDSVGDGYVQPDPKSIEDSDLDDYELPPTEGGYVKV